MQFTPNELFFYSWHKGFLNKFYKIATAVPKQTLLTIIVISVC